MCINTDIYSLVLVKYMRESTSFFHDKHVMEKKHSALWQRAH